MANLPLDEAAQALLVESFSWELWGLYRDRVTTWNFNLPDATLGFIAGMIGYEAARAGEEQTKLGYMIRQNLCR